VEAIGRILAAHRERLKVGLIAFVVMSVLGTAAYAGMAGPSESPSRAGRFAALSAEDDMPPTPEATSTPEPEASLRPTEPPVDLPDVPASAPLLPLPSAAPTIAPSLVVAGPGSCSGVAAMMSATRAERETAARASDHGSRSDDLPALLFTEAPFPGWPFDLEGPITEADAGYRRNLQETPQMVSDHGFVAGFERRWTSGAQRTMDGADVRIDVYEFESIADALAFDEESVQNGNFCPYVSDTFLIPSVPGATGVHDDATCAVCLQVTFVRGPRRFVVSHTIAEFRGYEDVARIAGAQAAVAD
jgi:hypothetical protein